MNYIRCLIKLDEVFNKLKMKLIVSIRKNDDLDIYLEIHAGAGGTESQDWANMLRRMYMKWFDKKFKYKIISEHSDEAGIKSSTIKGSGEYLYGLMRSESGVHRLVEYLRLIVEQEDTQVLQVGLSSSRR